MITVIVCGTDYEADDFFNVETVGSHDYDAITDIIKKTNDAYIMFANDGDVLRYEGRTEELAAIFEKNNEDVFVTNRQYADEEQNCKFETGVFDLEQSPKKLPLWIFDVIIPAKVLKNKNIKCEYDVLLTLWQYLESHSKVFMLKEFVHITDKYPDTDANNRRLLKKTWYMEFVSSMLRCENASYLEQRAILYLLWFRYKFNMNNGDKHVIDDEYDEFTRNVYELLQKIDDDAILGQDFFSCPLHFRISMMELKHGDRYHVTYINAENRIYACGEGIPFQNCQNLKINLDLLEYDEKNDTLILEYHIDNFVMLNQLEVKCFLGEKEIAQEETYRYSHTKYFGKGVQRALTYRVSINNFKEEIENENKICWIMKAKRKNMVLMINAKHYCARLNSTIKSTYYSKGQFTFSFSGGNKYIRIQHRNVIRSLFKELGFFYSNISFSKRFILAFGIRTLYWMTHPFFKKKVIWLTYDKLYKGGDCGEYMYKYMKDNGKKDGICACYTINGDSEDYKRLKKEGYNPLRYKSLKHYLYYLNSSVVFTTHGGVYNFNGFGKTTVPYVQNLLHHDVACIQHGLSVQQLAYNSARLCNNMKRYYCASKYEVENLSKPIYGYEDKSILKLTGIPRYDGLVNRDKRQILITPTWRNYIALPAGKKNEAKPYFDGFKKTDYYKIYNALLSDERLIECAKRNNYKLIYLLHPVISAQIDDYPKNDAVDIVPALTVNYEKILTESSLMMTDYSGVQFDFAYMRKPVVYYHPDELPPHYKEGGFFYDTMGFGEICKKHEEIVDVLCRYMDNGCAINPQYKERYDEFFAYNDLNSCKRIYEDMLSYQKELGCV